MPRLEFEKQMARQLKERELKPSAESWEKLQERLQTEEKRKSPGYWWMGIAASMVAAFILFTFLKPDPGVENSPGIVNTPGQQNEKSVDQEASMEGSTVEETEDNSETVPLRRGVLLPEATREISTAKQNSEVASAGETEDFKSAQEPQPEKEFSDVLRSEEQTALVSPEMTGETGISDAEINMLLEKAIAEVSREEGGETEVTDAEIDALMAEARAGIRQEQALYRMATLSADQLLTEVETELEHSFRAQVFEIIKDGLRKTRNAVADINE